MAAAEGLGAQPAVPGPRRRGVPGAIAAVRPGAGALNAGKSALLRQRRPRSLPSPCKRGRKKKKKALVFIHNFFFFFSSSSSFLPVSCAFRASPRSERRGRRVAACPGLPGEGVAAFPRGVGKGGVAEGWGGSADTRCRHCRLCLPCEQKHEVCRRLCCTFVLFYWWGVRG